MARKRRKLNKDMEAQIAAAQKKVEFISAVIRDITEEDIQNEYAEAFASIHLTAKQLAELYKTDGFTEVTEGLLTNYGELLATFEEDFEL
jgi:N-methylhydantoinase B/oxoprolinase/acetone carboxylase alpha subunit